MIDPDTDKGNEFVIVEPETMPEIGNVIIPSSINMQLPLESVRSCQLWGRVSDPAKRDPCCAIANIDGPLAVTGAGVPFTQPGEAELHLTVSFAVPLHHPVMSTRASVDKGARVPDVVGC